MSAKIYDVDLIEKAARFKLDSEFHVHLKPAVVLAMCADLRRYERALRWYADWSAADYGETARKALAGDSDEQGRRAGGDDEWRS